MCCSIVCLPAYLPSPISCTIVRNQCVSAHCTYYHDHQLLDPSRSCSGGGGGFAHSQTLESEWEAASHHLLIVLARGLSLVASRPSACRLRRCSFLPLSPLSPPPPHERQRRRHAHCTTSPIERSRQAYLATHAPTLCCVSFDIAPSISINRTKRGRCSVFRSSRPSSSCWLSRSRC